MSEPTKLEQTLTRRPTVPEAEEILGLYFPVLDYGFVALTDYMGGDAAIDRAARTSYGAGTRKVNEQRGLMRYLRRHRHTSPSEMTEVVLHMGLPIFVARQLVRHRTASLNEYSGRYSEMPMLFYTPEPEQLGLQAKGNRQGRAQAADSDVYEQFLVGARNVRGEASVHYADMLEHGVARELARIDLPLSTYCYDSTTEVLTEDGFVQWPLVKEGARLGVWDPVRQSLCYEAPAFLTRQRYKGPMYRVSHRGVDLLVTPQHRMYVKLDRSDEPSLVPANVLGDRTLVRYIKRAPLNAPSVSEAIPAAFHRLTTRANTSALLSLVGFFIGDGTAPLKADRNALVFTLRKRRKIRFLSELCEQLGLVCELRSGVHYVVRAEGITDLFRAEFYDETTREKRIPAWLLRLGASDARAVIVGLCASDGHAYGASSNVFSSTSLSVAEGAVRLGLHAGVAVNGPYLVKQATELRKAAYEVYFVSERCSEPVINQMTQNTWEEEYDGEVFCAKTRTGILVVRRNGKVSLSGNTYWYWKMDLNNLLHFLGLRCDPHAQWEIRAFANVIAGIVQRVAPDTFEAWLDYEFCSATFSRQEMQVMREVFFRRSGGMMLMNPPTLREAGCSNREIDEFFAKWRKDYSTPPYFFLDLSKAVGPEHFADIIDKAVPAVDRKVAQ